MSFYVDSAFLDDITTVARTVPLAGATTNPTILRAARERGQDLDHFQVLEQLLQLLDGLIFMQPGASEEETMYSQALALVQVAPERVIPKIPMTAIGVRVARRLQQQACRFSFTAVTTAAQACIGVQAGADFVIPYYGRLTNAGINASQRIGEIAAVLKQADRPARILAASIKSARDATQALISGAHDLTVAPQVLLDMVSDPLSEEAVARFSRDWEALNKL